MNIDRLGREVAYRTALAVTAVGSILTPVIHEGTSPRCINFGQSQDSPVSAKGDPEPEIINNGGGGHQGDEGKYTDLIDSLAIGMGQQEDEGKYLDLLVGSGPDSDVTSESGLNESSLDMEDPISVDSSDGSSPGPGIPEEGQFFDSELDENDPIRVSSD